MRSILGFGLTAIVGAAVACSSAPADGTETSASDMTAGGGGAAPIQALRLPAAGTPTTADPVSCNLRSPMPGLMSASPAMPVMAGTVNVYVIWYGEWTNLDFPWSAQQGIVTNFVQALGGSPYFAVNTQFAGANGAVSGQLAYGGLAVDAGSLGTHLGPGAAGAVVSNVLRQGWLPVDANGIYLVMTAQGVTETNGSGSFCTDYCGYHTRLTYDGVDVKYAFVGNPYTCPGDDSCLDHCAGTPTPNGYPDADQMVSVIAHELSESVTDPTTSVSGWRDSAGWENGDKCAWFYGNTYAAANGAKANLSLGGHDYLVQEAWINQGSGFCAMALPAAPACSVSQACDTGLVTFGCTAVQGDLVVQRQDVGGAVTTLATVPAATAQFSGGGVSDTPTGSGTVGYRGCANTGAGQMCSAWSTVGVPAPACPPPLKCPKGWVNCGDYCARTAKLCF